MVCKRRYYTGADDCAAPVSYTHLDVYKRQGPTSETIPKDEFFAFLSKRRRLLDGVCITGGKLLLHPDLPGFLNRIKALGYPVKLDTNGNHPKQLICLWENGYGQQGFYVRL